MAEGKNVPGLVTEALTLNELMGKLKVLVPEMLQLNEALPIRS